MSFTDHFAVAARCRKVTLADAPLLAVEDFGHTWTVRIFRSCRPLRRQCKTRPRSLVLLARRKRLGNQPTRSRKCTRRHGLQKFLSWNELFRTGSVRPLALKHQEKVVGLSDPPGEWQRTAMPRLSFPKSMPPKSLSNPTELHERKPGNVRREPEKSVGEAKRRRAWRRRSGPLRRPGRRSRAKAPEEAWVGVIV